MIALTSPPEATQGRVPLEIGGVRTIIRCEEESYLDLVRDRYEGFRIPSGDGEHPLSYTLHVTVQEDLLPGSEVTPTVERTPDGFRLHRRDFMMDLDLERRTLTGSVARSMYSFDSMLRVFFTLILLDMDGVLVHGSSIVEGGRAFLFYGVSGSGKTTTTILSEPRTILSDELTLVRKVGEEYRAFGTPFWGELQKNGENINAPLHRILWLRKDPEVYLEEQTPRQALQRLLPCILFFAQEPDLVNRVVDRVVDLVEHVPTAALHFRKDDSFWTLLTENQ
ncbi:MAG: hypothetical protein KY468_03000 [Armatimonadetes bacterium]|nr:hypothetical protein [Armatimonadota bacterium]